MNLSELARRHNRDWADRGLHRTPGTFASAQHPVACIDGRDYVLFSSSNYLSLSAHPQVIHAASHATARFGAGSGGSRLTTGTTELHRAAESALATFLGAEDCVLFATGYQANLSTIATLAATSGDLCIFSDSLNHASIIDGCRIARTDLQVFPHGDYHSLGRMLAGRSSRDALVISDGLFSMDGDIADLPALQQVCKEHGAWLMIDDAHAIGSLGASGKGSSELHSCQLPEILVGTASKALGTEGGFVACSHEIAALLRDRARSYVFSTATSAAAPAAVLAALPLVPEQLPKLRRNIQLLTQRLGLPATSSPIIPIRVGEETAALAAAAELKAAGLWVPAIRFPTVARGAAILRVTMMADHTAEHIEMLAHQLSSS
ncbi:aminotransferase class I/II-fold pyridoxal phosphate-dependent enzyme [Corynebacterium sp. H128]|uniref:aminotransferase class I/II-fold pyridoxal phosphate-dependent enzyme n=1 Tax=Corynebacterium sp. H128 TaxID=3133427 RepID=UPI0030B182DC